MDTNKNVVWLKETGIKAVKTMAQTAVALIGTNTVGITSVDWVAVASATALAGVLCVLTNVANLPTGDKHEIY